MAAAEADRSPDVRKAVPLHAVRSTASILGSPRGGTRMAQGDETHIEVRLEVEHVPYRSAAWRELWRQIFEAVAEDEDAHLLAPRNAGGSPAGGQETREHRRL